jgi:hypothetical protein
MKRIFNEYYLELDEIAHAIEFTAKRIIQEILISKK